MLETKWIEENPEKLDEALKKRGLEPQAHFLVEKLRQRRALDTLIQEKRQQRNKLPEAIEQAKKEDKEDSLTHLLHKAAQLKEEIQAQEQMLKNLKQELDNHLACLPNIPLDDIPTGVDERGNVVLSTWGNIPTFSFKPQSHVELGEKLAMMDFETAAHLSGSRFVILKGLLSKLERALAHFMLQVHTQEFGYTEVTPPFLVKGQAMFGTAQLPKFSFDQFQTNHDLWLIPTAEVPLTNLVRDKILEEKDLPLRFVAYTPCFRLEAGASGKDTRGMLRQHQFSKVELVSITSHEEAVAEHERLTQCAQTILERLVLPFRKIVLCTGDMGFSAVKTYDLEVWLPSQETYREISSCSLCGTFQARRMMARYRRRRDQRLVFVYTLNGSGLAVGRTLIAVLEHYQQEDGSIIVPECLRSFMGCQVIKKA